VVCRLKTCTTLESSGPATWQMPCRVSTLPLRYVSFLARQIVLGGVQAQDLYDPREQWASYLTNGFKLIRDSSVKAWLTSVVASQVDLVCRLKTCMTLESSGPAT